MRRHAQRGLSAVAALCLWASAASAPQSAKVRLAIGSKPGNLVYLQIDLARALGYFEQEGLAVDFQYCDGGPAAASALVTGKADFSGNSIDHAVVLRSEGKDLKMIASFTNLPTVTLVVSRGLRPAIRSLADLKGRRIGVTATAAGTHALLASIVKRAGLNLADITVVPVGAGESLIQSLRRHQIDAAMATDPTTTAVLMSGDASLLLDMVTPEETERVFKGEYQFTGVLTRADTIRDRPELVQKMVNVIVRANRYIATHSAAAIAAALPVELVHDRYIYVKGLEHSRPAFSKDGLVALAGVANNIQAQVALGSIPSTTIDAQALTDMRFVKIAQSQRPPH